MQSLKNLASLAFPIIAVGLLTLFAIDFLYTLFLNGHVEKDQEKFIMETISFLMGHFFTKITQSK